MLNKKLIVLAKSAPPAVCGMSDYSYLTAKALTKFYPEVIVGVNELPVATEQANVKQLPVIHWKKALQSGLVNEPVDVLINYTPTAYSKFGWSGQLIKTLKEFKSINKGNRIFVHFHESWLGTANLKPHHAIKDYLTKLSMKKVNELANGVGVFTESQQQKLEQSFGTQNINLNLIGTNILPADKDAGLHSIRNVGEYVVFGLPHTRLWTIQMYLPLLKSLHAKGLLKKIISIGPKEGKFAIQEAAAVAEHIGPNILNQLGALETSELSEHFLHAQAALVGQSPDSLRKSSSFAALIAHAIPVVCEVPKTLTDPPGNWIFTPTEILENPDLLTNEDGKSRVQNMHTWFWKNRSWDAIGNNVYNWINDNTVLLKAPLNN